jgi:hypothetical protein
MSAPQSTLVPGGTDWIGVPNGSAEPASDAGF